VLPSTAQVAFQQADYAAWNVWASINGRAALPFRYQHIGDMMVLGALDAAVALPVGDITIDGPAAAALRRVAYLYRMPTNEHRIKVAQRWLEDGVEDFARDPAAFLARLPNPFATFP
jgi:demethylphylloquinone reductase